jgi:glycosyltransferase involved in cell wall biosynthesis
LGEPSFVTGPVPGVASGVTAPDLSVIVPARNEEAFIERALDSVAGQSVALERVEVVVAANGCTDCTVELALAWAATHPALRVEVLDLPEPGLSSAKNAAVGAARGRLLLFLDADSRMRHDLAAEIFALEASGTRAGTIRIDADTHDSLDRAFFRMIELGKRRGSKGMMFFCARDDFHAVGGFDPELHHAEDLVVQQRLDAAGVPFGYLGTSGILTSPRRLHTRRFRLGMLTMLARWSLASAGIGRRWRY